MKDKEFFADVQVRIVVELDDDCNKILSQRIETSATDEGIEEILSAWLHGQMGKGADKTPPKKNNPYVVDVCVDLSDDTFVVSSNTGNKGLTTGIVLDALQAFRRNMINVVRK